MRDIIWKPEPEGTLLRSRISAEVMKGRVQSIRSYKIDYENNTHNGSEGREGPIIAYNYSEDGSFKAFKYCRPRLGGNKKWRWERKFDSLDYFPHDIMDVEGDDIFLVGGEKDALTMLTLGFDAFCLNSETATLTDELHRKALSNHKRLLVLYDIDSTGVKNSKEISADFQCLRVELPDQINGMTYGNDVTDLINFRVKGEEEVALKILSNAIAKATIEPPREKTVTLDARLVKVNEHTESIRSLKSGTIAFPPPLITMGGPESGLIFPYTINVIQGKTGAHKSRVAEIMASLFLSIPDHPHKNVFLGMEKKEQPYHVVYVDTERNIKHQLPYTIQSIQERAGIPREMDPENFEYITLLHEERSERFRILDTFLKEVNKRRKGFVVVILDVVTDCVTDFNSLSESMKMIDMMNVMINDEQCSFICVIHENPQSNADKARGHLGSEVVNKASLQLRVGFTDTEEGDRVIKAEVVKNRLADTRLFQSWFMDYDKGLRSLMRTERLNEINWTDMQAMLDEERKKFIEEPVVDTAPEELKNELQPNIEFDEEKKEEGLLDGPDMVFEEEGEDKGLDVKSFLDKVREEKKDWAPEPQTEEDDLPF